MGIGGCHRVIVGVLYDVRRWRGIVALSFFLLFLRCFMWFSGKARVRAAVLALAIGFGSAQAQYVIDYIDFNE